ncbi:hypothetical protein E2I00_018806 [Balaenoptera physalus]|uniref:Uncharacterized protein n=1 Tax=Balaenoptera physalus TaxID=9770 RepID=A0A6A1QBW9_BALPH|nr:hypothetical protein E2I00_018806 [Balaenoptera physalus]
MPAHSRNISVRPPAAQALNLLPSSVLQWATECTSCKGSPSSLSRGGEEETQEEAPGAEPQFLFHGCEMPRML